MKLFLASSFSQVSKLLLDKIGVVNGKTVLFVANASDKQDGDKWWVEADRKAFEELKCKIIEIDLRKMSAEDLSKQMGNADIIHFCGGSVLYLISLLKERGLAEIVVDFVKKNKIIYTGTSAGSMIVSKDLTVSTYDKDEKPLIEKNKIYTGLDLINFIIIPHSRSLDFLEANIEIVKNLPQNTTPLLFLNDNHAVWVENQKFEILES